MKAKKKQYLVLGLGRFGSSVARSLCEMGHEVLAVDSDADAVASVAPYVTQCVQADATDEEVLASFAPGSFDAAVVSVGGNVQDSVMMSLLCKEQGVPFVIAKANNDLHGKLLRKIGVDRVIFPERDMGHRLARWLVMPSVLDMMELSDDHQIAEVMTPDGWVERTLVQIDVRRRYGVSVIAVRRGTQLITSPGADMKLESGDVLILIGKQQDIDSIR